MKKAYRAWLSEAVESSQYSKDQVAQLCGVSPRALQSYIYGDRGVRPAFINRAAELFDLDLAATLQAEARYIEERQRAKAPLLACQEAEAKQNTA